MGFRERPSLCAKDNNTIGNYADVTVGLSFFINLLLLRVDGCMTLCRKCCLSKESYDTTLTQMTCGQKVSLGAIILQNNYLNNADRI